MKIKFDVSPAEYQRIHDILQAHLPADCQVWVFGSRAKHQTLHGSDLDLALEGQLKIEPTVIWKLETAFEESPLPYRVDIIDLKAISEEFFKQIKMQLVPFYEGKNQPEARIPKLRFPEFEGEWNNYKLGNEVEIFNGYAFASADSTETGIPWVKIADVGVNTMKTDKRSYLPSYFDKKHSKFVLKRGDIVVALTRPILSGKLKIARINECFSGGLLNQRVGKISSENNLDFIYQLFQKSGLISKIENQIDGSDPPNLAPSTLKVINQAFPKLPEQQKIATFLTAVDQKIDLLQRKKDQLTAYKKGMMQKLFSQELRFKDENGNDFPEWEEKKLEEVAEIIGGGTPETIKEDYWRGEINWFTPTEIKTKYLIHSKRKISELGLKKSSAKMLPAGALLLSTRATVGDIGIATEECSTNQGFQSLVTNDDNCNEFWYYWITRNKKEFIRKSSGSTFIEISKTEIQKIKAHAPHLAEQQKIATYLTAIDRKIELTDKNLTQAQAFKKGLLQQMFV